MWVWVVTYNVDHEGANVLAVASSDSKGKEIASADSSKPLTWVPDISVDESMGEIATEREHYSWYAVTCHNVVD